MQKLANKLSDSNTCTFFDELGNVSEDRAVQKCAKLVDRPKSGRVSIYLQKSGSITAEKEPSEVSSNKGRLNGSARRHEASGWAIRAVCLKFPLATGFVATRLDPQD